MVGLRCLIEPGTPLTRAKSFGRLLFLLGMATAVALSLKGCAVVPKVGSAWTFAVAGDSRDCGNVVMPAIAASAQADRARFYWHLGDLRKTYEIDKDFAAERRFQQPGSVPTLSDYQHLAASDFLEHQVRPFGDIPFFVGIGNHETIAPASRLQFRTNMRQLLDRPELHSQRLSDRIPAAALESEALPPTYYHWRTHGVDFVYLDNATDDAFDDEQMSWFDEIIRRALEDPSIRTLVVGMHEALPHSLGNDHSMCASRQGIDSGEHVYRTLLRAREAGRHVYVLASHSHFYLDNIFDTPYRRSPAGGGVLDGWIIGTAGAERYPLPDGIAKGEGARSRVYGYLAATVEPNGKIDFRFRELRRAELAEHLSHDLDPRIVDACFDGNPAPSAPVRARQANQCD